MFGLSKTDKELEEVLQRLNMNASNNYKDAAQQNFTEFKETFELKKSMLSPKKFAHYENILKELNVSMDHYTHKDQKPDFSGLR